MAELENANRKEIIGQRLKVENNRITIPEKLPCFPDLTDLSRKSLALALGPIALLVHQGCKVDDIKIKVIINFFRYALAAKQLSDDAKDWLEDLRSGVITAVNNLVLQELKPEHGVLDLHDNLETIFISFSKIAPKIAKNIIDLCLEARETIAEIDPNRDYRILKELIEPLEKAAKKSLRFQRLLLEEDNNVII